MMEAAIGPRYKKTWNSLRMGLLCSVVATLTALGCSAPSDESQPARETVVQGSGISVRAVVTRQTGVNVALTDIRCVVLRVTGPGISIPINAQRVIPAQIREFTFEVHVPVGTARVFTVETFDQASACESAESALAFIPTFAGEAAVDIPPNGATVTVQMSPVEELVIRPLVAPDNVAGIPVDLQMRGS